MIHVLAIYILPNLIEKNEKKTFGHAAKTVTIVGTGKWIDFYIFVKVGYYPLLPLACTSIGACAVSVVYCLWLSTEMNWIEYIFYFFIFDIKDTNVKSYGL